jgi:hypothetical protein
VSRRVSAPRFVWFSPPARAINAQAPATLLAAFPQLWRKMPEITTKSRGKWRIFAICRIIF